MLQSNRLSAWGIEAKRQWKADAPKMYAELKKSGHLAKVLHSAQERAKSDFAVLVKQGMDPDEAQIEAQKTMHRYDPENDPERPQPWEREAGEESARAATEKLAASVPHPPRTRGAKTSGYLGKTTKNLTWRPRVVTREQISGSPLPPKPKPIFPSVPAPGFPLTLKPSSS